MKKILILLIAIVSLFSFNEVKAEEIAEAEQIQIDNLLTYAAENNISLDNVIVYKLNSIIYLFTTSTDFYFQVTPPYNNFILHSEIDLVTFNRLYYTDNEINSGTIAFYNNQSMFGSQSVVLYSSSDILNDDGSVFFAKNYPIDDDVEPEPSPSPSPEPTDTPEIDVSELEKCDSFVCDISDTILDGFDDERFPFVKIIIKFLLLLLLIFIIISPFWLIYKLARWLM